MIVELVPDIVQLCHDGLLRYNAQAAQNIYCSAADLVGSENC